MLELSSLNHTWLIDVDGTIVKHNGYKIDGYDTLLEGVKEFFDGIDPNDTIILLTARKKEYLEDLKIFLNKNNIRYDYILADIPVGERILINDTKPNGLKTAIAKNLNRNEFMVSYKINEDLWFDKVIWNKERK